MARSVTRGVALGVLLAVAAVVSVAGPAFADYESDNKSCGKEYGYTQTRSTGVTYATPPGGVEKYVGDFARMQTRQTFVGPNNPGGGFWDATAGALNRTETFAGCVYATP